MNIHPSSRFSPTTWFGTLVAEIGPFFELLKLRPTLVCGLILCLIYFFTSQTNIDTEKVYRPNLGLNLVSREKSGNLKVEK